MSTLKQDRNSAASMRHSSTFHRQPALTQPAPPLLSVLLVLKEASWGLDHQVLEGSASSPCSHAIRRLQGYEGTKYCSFHANQCQGFSRLLLGDLLTAGQILLPRRTTCSAHHSGSVDRNSPFLSSVAGRPGQIPWTLTSSMESSLAIGCRFAQGQTPNSDRAGLATLITYQRQMK